MLLDRFMVVLYKTGFLSECVWRMLAKTERISLPNLLAGRDVYPELLQRHATPKNAMEALLRYLRDPEYRDAVLAAFGVPGRGWESPERLHSGRRVFCPARSKRGVGAAAYRGGHLREQEDRFAESQRPRRALGVGSPFARGAASPAAGTCRSGFFPVSSRRGKSAASRLLSRYSGCNRTGIVSPDGALPAEIRGKGRTEPLPTRWCSSAATCSGGGCSPRAPGAALLLLVRAKNGIERCAALFTAYREMAESIASSGEGQALQRTGRILLAGDLAAELPDAFVHAPHGEDRIPEGRPRVAFFPGSREHIRKYAVPLIREAVAALRETFPSLDARIILSPFASAGEEEAFRRSGDLTPVREEAKRRFGALTSL